ncbi:hypothetical protein FOA52_000163 [Chlamydomonas sp. UWO 241]|nr:hypothetical protein FOA52_000163 [Chlamydomonas sp. UWO 241]
MIAGRASGAAPEAKGPAPSKVPTGGPAEPDVGTTGTQLVLNTEFQGIDFLKPEVIVHISEEANPAPSRALSWSLIGLTAACIGLLLGLCSYAEFDLAAGDTPNEQTRLYYSWFMDVNVMIFVGFGFLMTFLRRYSYSAVGLNMLASCLIVIEAVLVVGATQQVWHLGATSIHVGLPLLINALFAAAAGMIAFGAVIGKTTPTQLIWLMVLMVPFYAINQYVVVYVIKALDLGGTIVIHIFGAYFGLAASFVFSRGRTAATSFGITHPKNGAAYLNDILSMVGTLFLFLYWPSFNAALAGLPTAMMAGSTEAAQSAQFLSVVNTFLSLCGATVATFAVSALIGGGKLSMVHVQNSTLAGGVAMGAACSLRVSPGGCVIVGALAGALSVCGFVYGTPLLENKLGVTDTCGVHNLHGMPAIYGAVVAGIVSLWQHNNYLMYDTGVMQLGYQFAAIACTIGIAVASGLASAQVVLLATNRGSVMDPETAFEDSEWWFLNKEPFTALELDHTPPGSMASFQVGRSGVGTLACSPSFTPPHSAVHSMHASPLHEAHTFRRCSHPPPSSVDLPGHTRARPSRQTVDPLVRPSEV